MINDTVSQNVISAMGNRKSRTVNRMESAGDRVEWSG